jgi:hypothetical protein
MKIVMLRRAYTPFFSFDKLKVKIGATCFNKGKEQLLAIFFLLSGPKVLV